MSDCGKEIKQTASGTAAAKPLEPAARGQRTPLRPEDFYMEGPYLVFTAAYHLRRGYCCDSGCRHCPYK